ncbi:MAG: serine/threonine protein kinase, partial [Myxococcales bacterium]|nr:serine/threonine protein kinase [Myxococcales bacterium]
FPPPPRSVSRGPPPAGRAAYTRVHAAQARPKELAIAETLGPYALESVLGEGSMGIVYRARREPAGEIVALKVLRERLSGDPTYLSRFRREARAASEIEHPNLVRVVDAGEIEGSFYVASAYYEGGTLADRIASGALSLSEALGVATQIGAALDALHSVGLVHRDVKPSNIMLDGEGTAALTDFGLAKGPAYTVLTRPGQVMGTVEYLAPELVTGEAATLASDLYALGCVVYECLAGAPPFASENVFEALTMHLDSEPADLHAIRPDVPAALSFAVLTALAKEPGKRPPSARAYGLLLASGARATGSN